MFVFFTHTKKEPSTNYYAERWGEGISNEIMRAYTHKHTQNINTYIQAHTHT